MPITIPPEWQQIAFYALGAALVLILLQRIPYVGRVVRFAFSLGLLALFIFLLIQQAPYEPNLARLAGQLGLDRQEVVGKELRIKMAPDGHFWANATINGQKVRMLIDSGATITALSERTAAAAGISRQAGVVPVILRTANGLTKAETGAIEDLRMGNVRAGNLKVLISPGLGDVDILGMNFLSKLSSWRVEGKTLVMVPHNPQPAAGSAKAS